MSKHLPNLPRLFALSLLALVVAAGCGDGAKEDAKNEAKDEAKNTDGENNDKPTDVKPWLAAEIERETDPGKKRALEAMKEYVEMGPESSDQGMLFLDDMNLTEVPRAVAKIDGVFDLHLSGNPITDEGLNTDVLKGFSSVYLNGTKITDQGLKKLQDVEGITSLSVYATNVTRDGVLAFKKARPDCTISSEFKFEDVGKDKALKDKGEFKDKGKF